MKNIIGMETNIYGAELNNLKNIYKREYDFAFSSRGLDYTASASRTYALSKLRQISRCGHLL